jgi:hypothetical protein
LRVTAETLPPLNVRSNRFGVASPAKRAAIPVHLAGVPVNRKDPSQRAPRSRGPRPPEALPAADQFQSRASWSALLEIPHFRRRPQHCRLIAPDSPESPVNPSDHPDGIASVRQELAVGRGKSGISRLRRPRTVSRALRRRASQTQHGHSRSRHHTAAGA